MSQLKPIKCPYCEGSKVRGRKTLYLYPNNHFHCFRCQAHGTIDKLNDVEIEFSTPSRIQIPEWNNQGDRFSVCQKRHYENHVDHFEIKDSSGNPKGVYTRKEEHSNIQGSRAFLYKDNYLAFDKTYRIVEGPYDCVYPNDVALMGYPSSAQAKMLKPYRLILTPDGDVWYNKESLLQWLKPFWYHKIEAVEYLKGGLDPDEVVLKNRVVVSFEEVKDYLRS